MKIQSHLRSVADIWDTEQRTRDSGVELVQRFRRGQSRTHATRLVRKTGGVDREQIDRPREARIIAAKSARATKRPKTTARKAVRARLPASDGSQVIRNAEPRLVGYARVSTDEQTTAPQLDALHAAGCAVIHEDSASGALRSRPGLDRALADLHAGDTLVVWRLDRLGRSLRHLLDVSEMLRGRDVALRSLTDHIDTGTAAGRMLYAVLGAVAQFERDVLRERTVAGLAAAKRRGERLGRPPALAPAQIREAQKMLDRGESQSRRTRLTRRSINAIPASGMIVTFKQPFKQVFEARAAQILTTPFFWALRGTYEAQAAIRGAPPRRGMQSESRTRSRQRRGTDSSRSD